MFYEQNETDLPLISIYKHFFHLSILPFYLSAISEGSIKGGSLKITTLTAGVVGVAGGKSGAFIGLLSGTLGLQPPILSDG